MYDGYDEVFAMAQALGKPQKPLWYDEGGCPRWEPPPEDIAPFVRPIRCQACGQEMRVCLVDLVYRGYKGFKFGIPHGTLPRHWHYGDAPAHPSPEHWGPDWWTKGWDAGCAGTTMNSIPEWEFPEWDFSRGMPIYDQDKALHVEKD